MTSAVDIDSCAIADLTIQNQNGEVSEQMDGCESYGFCAICLDKIPIQETALVKGCEHAYCLTCILRWASYKENTTCPQCKHPFETLIGHRALDGRYVNNENQNKTMQENQNKTLINSK
ncbi:hypothetical protein QQ045_015935 [Rhodiola kirilowii]